MIRDRNLLGMKTLAFFDIVWLIIGLIGPIAFGIVGLVESNWGALLGATFTIPICYGVSLLWLLPNIEKELKEIKNYKNKHLPKKIKKEIDKVEEDLCLQMKEENEMKDLDLQRRIDSLLKDSWSYGKLAKELGVSKTTISRWIRGLQDPSPAAEKVLNNKLDFLLEGSTNKALCPNCYEHLVEKNNEQRCL